MTSSPATTENWQTEAKRIADSVRLRVLDHTLKNNGGYMSQACSSAETFSALYTKIMKLGPSIAPSVPPPFPGAPSASNPNYFTGAGYNGAKSPELDRFIFSPAHYALVLYTVLIETGRMSAEGLEQFNKDGSTVEMIGAEHSPGCEVTSGSLAQALSQAAGIALARKQRGETGRVWVYMSDGEFQEGQTWEALEVMSFYKLDNMGIYVDINGQQCDGCMCDVMDIDPLHQKLEAFGMRVFSVDGHDLNALAAPAELEPDGRPLIVLAKTDPCRGLPRLQSRAPKLHYLRFTSPEEREGYAQDYVEMTAAREGGK
ncbi:MAG: transketolase [Chloroflexota bacterium]